MEIAQVGCSSSECVSAALDDLDQEGRGEWKVTKCDHDGFWKSHAQLVRESEALAGKYPEVEELRDREVVLGFLGRSHVGDVICASSLARLLATERNCRVLSVRHRSTYKVLENNPHISGYCNAGRIALSSYISGPGQISQKLNRSFGFAPDPFIRGDLFLSDDELKWAWAVRNMLPRNRPVAIVIAGSRTDNHAVPTADLQWQRWIDVIGRRFTVVQVAVTKFSCLEETARLTEGDKRAWRPDQILDNCILLENISARQFFAVFAIADMFVGRNTAGMHVAAAMQVPSLIVLSKRRYPRFPTFPENIHPPSWKHESFFYPYHNFLLQSD